MKITYPAFQAKFHLVLTVIWFLLIFPSVLWWKHSVPWLVLMSVWANFASHFAAYQGAKSEEAKG